MPKVNIAEMYRAGFAEKCKLERFLTTSRDASAVLPPPGFWQGISLFRSNFFKQKIQIFSGVPYLRCVSHSKISAQFAEVAEVALTGCEPTLVSTEISSLFDDAVGNVVVLSRLSHRLGISSYQEGGTYLRSTRCSYIEKGSKEAAN
jgi:hypothetical protein